MIKKDTSNAGVNIPILDISGCQNHRERRQSVALQLHKACREFGFFYIVGHGVDPKLTRRLEELSKIFFALELNTKMQIRMELGGAAWRGYFPLGQELTSGKPDLKEGLYFGRELASDHPLVKKGIPLHGPNLFPDINDFRRTVLAYIDAVTDVGHLLMQIISLSLGLDENYFMDHYTKNPLILFRIFHYPPDPQSTAPTWGVGEHTDYGVLTILKQDDCGGLQVKSHSQWIDAPPIENSFVCNIGDMLDRMTGGLYLSTPHRVRNISGKNRYSFPLFFDPGFDQDIKPIFHDRAPIDHQQERWDKTNIHNDQVVQGTYGEYLMGKIGKVFPELKNSVLPKKS